MSIQKDILDEVQDEVTKLHGYNIVSCDAQKLDDIGRHPLVKTGAQQSRKLL